MKRTSQKIYHIASQSIGLFFKANLYIQAKQKMEERIQTFGFFAIECNL